MFITRLWTHSHLLGEAMDRWIRHHFFRAKRAKCLIIIGPSGTGKTAFALSLPGRPNYYQERWKLDTWNDCARYSVYDDIPWNDFAKLNFPSKKNLLTQKWTKISVRHSKPSLVLFFFSPFCLIASILRCTGHGQISRDKTDQCSTTSHRSIES
jgi:hypothetical protein